MNYIQKWSIPPVPVSSDAAGGFMATDLSYFLADRHPAALDLGVASYAATPCARAVAEVGGWMVEFALPRWREDVVLVVWIAVETKVA